MIQPLAPLYAHRNSYGISTFMNELSRGNFDWLPVSYMRNDVIHEWFPA